MSTTRKAPLLVATAALGLIAATAIVVYAASSNRSSGQQPQQQQASDRSAAEKRTSSAMGKAEKEEEEEALTPPAPPLAIAPAPAGFKALVVCAEGGEEATAAAAWASASRGAGAAVSVCPPGFLGSHAGASAGTYDSIVVEDGERLSGAVLGEVLKLLKAGGKVSVVVSPADTIAAAAAASTKRDLTFAGFVEVAPSLEDGRVLVGKRAPWDAGASAPVRVSFRRTKPAPAPALASNGVSVSNGGGGGVNPPVEVVQPVKKTWTLALDDDDDDGEEGGGMFGAGGGGGDGEDEDLVDEDALLEGSAPVKRASEADAAGCATKRRACKDCSCGRAEMEEAGEAGGPPRPVASVADVDDALTSACGNCSKGDAFRCGGCPFLGKPAFAKGQEKLIMLSDLDSQQDD